jgi:hypothetical protein
MKAARICRGFLKEPGLDELARMTRVTLLGKKARTTKERLQEKCELTSYN